MYPEEFPNKHVNFHFLWYPAPQISPSGSGMENRKILVVYSILVFFLVAFSFLICARHLCSHILSWALSPRSLRYDTPVTKHCKPHANVLGLFCNGVQPFLTSFREGRNVVVFAPRVKFTALLLQWGCNSSCLCGRPSRFNYYLILI